MKPELKRELDDLKELLQNELKKINKKGDLTPSELDSATKVVCLLEMIEKYKARYESEEGSDGYSMRRPPMYSYDGYSRRPAMYNNRNGHSGGYNRHGDHDGYADMLEGMLGEAQTEAERRTLMDFIDRLRTN